MTIERAIRKFEIVICGMFHEKYIVEEEGYRGTTDLRCKKCGLVYLGK